MKFNFMKIRSKVSVNYENAKAHLMTPELELYAAVVTTGSNDSFYESADNRLVRMKGLMAKCDAAFVQKLAIYARTEMHLRSVPLVLAVELAKQHSGNGLISKAIEKMVLRADEITELLGILSIGK